MSMYSKTLALAAILFAGSWIAGAQTADYASVHKYRIDPKTASSGDPRKEFTYTITSVMRIAKPYRLSDMTDDYQDARLLSEDKDSATVEFVYYPFNTNREAIGENPNWKRDYAGMRDYLRPTITENWDGNMRADLLAELRQDGIDPDELTDKQLVTQVSHWLMRRNRYTKTFAVWYVHFPGGKPEVFPALRKNFDAEKSSPAMTDQGLFDIEVLGRSMFDNRTRGSCTSSAVLLATVMRALGIPSRIVFFVPAADGNDPRQREMLLSNIHNDAIRAQVLRGLPSSHGNFTNHLYNEVFVGNRWVRLNYDALGQNIVDEKYLGLMTHIYTTDSLSHVPMAETWGSRYAKYPDFSPKLSSINPYQLLNVSDHLGAYSSIENTTVENAELKQVTVIEAWWRAALPASLPEPLASKIANDPAASDFYIGIQEFIPRFPLQLREFASHAGSRFTLAAPGAPEVHAALSGMKLTSGDGPRTYSLFGLRIDAADRNLVHPGVKYTIHPINTSETYRWTVRDGLVLESTALAR